MAQLKRLAQNFTFSSLKVIVSKYKSKNLFPFRNSLNVDCNAILPDPVELPDNQTGKKRKKM